MLLLDRTSRQRGYSLVIANAARRQSVRGALPRARRDLVGVAHRVKVEWKFAHSEREAFLAFYNRVAFTGEKFQAPLVSGSLEPLPHVCEIVPGTLRQSEDLNGVVFACDLQVEPLTAEYSPDHDQLVVMIYEEYGGDITGVVVALAALVNEDLP